MWWEKLDSSVIKSRTDTTPVVLDLIIGISCLLLKLHETVTYCNMWMAYNRGIICVVSHRNLGASGGYNKMLT